jgi:S1-C subfamily serine protease
MMNRNNRSTWEKMKRQLWPLLVAPFLFISCASPQITYVSPELKSRFNIYDESELETLKYERRGPTDSYYCKAWTWERSIDLNQTLNDLTHKGRALGGNALLNLKCVTEQTSMTCWESISCVASAIKLQGSGDRHITPKPPISPTLEPPGPEPSAKQKMVAGGTGFLFSSKDYVITNYHVVEGASSIRAKFTNGKTVEAMVVAKDPKNDIAILKLANAPPLSATQIKLGDSSHARAGEKIFTIGYPASKIMGEKPKYSEGVINSMTGLKDDPTFFQVSVPIQPGNSGGPLFNERGEVIGITTSSLSLLAIDAMGAIPQNVNYAIKSSFVKNLLSTIPELMLSNKNIVVVSKESGNSLPNFIEQVSKNIVLIEAKE